MTRCVAIASALAVALAGCGGGDEPQPATTGGLVWTQTPLLLSQGQAPDRVLQGRVRNDSLRPLDVRAQDVRVLDAGGRRVAASVIFVNGISKPLYRVDRPYQVQPYDFRRLGMELELKPGQEAPLTVAWRVPQAPVRLDYGEGSLAIGTPQRVTPGTAAQHTPR